ncbi:MFS transporter [Olivibacter sitiensis]|uniref:MFS transporter n=1 Tax=Olivibacter sitiensis TaxID=376470 RepID=UPI000412BD09|nr:MFS transporter [Olivibacter sitiensis]
MNKVPVPKDNKSTIRAWAMFDWANSAYNLVITSTIFPAYYTAITTTEEHGDKVRFFGVEFVNTALENYAMAAAYLLMALTLPIASAMADRYGKRKQYMQFFTYMGAAACMGLFFFDLGNLEWGVILSAIAAMGYVGGVMFNNSYLPEIASTDEQDRVSAQGFAYGYVGSVLLQIVCFILIFKKEWFGIVDDTLPVRISFFLVGLWWLGFSQIPFNKLQNNKPSSANGKSNVWASGFSELRKVWLRIKELTLLKRFLASYFFYAMGVQTIMLVAAAFGEKVLHLGASKLIITILLIQIVAILGAYLMSYLARRLGNVRVLVLILICWVIVALSAYFLRFEWQFYLLASLVGLVMGGVQSLSRSTYSKLLPSDSVDNTSFFSFYDVTEKFAIVVGLFTFGFVETITDNIRYSALCLGAFFVIGLILLLRLPNSFFLKRQ